jgi:putative tricarboxylic transport membrane protein
VCSSDLDIVFSLILLIFFSITLIRMDKLIGPFHPNVPFETSPSFFPAYLVSGILLLLVCLMVAQVLELKKISSHPGTVEESEESFSSWILFKTVPLVLLFIYSMNYLGFLVSGLLLLFFLQMILGNRTWWKIALFSGGIVFFCYLVFIRLLYIQLPRGVGIFEQMSFLFY